MGPAVRAQEVRPYCPERGRIIEGGIRSLHNHLGDALKRQGR